MGREKLLSDKLFYTNFSLEKRIRKNHPLRLVKELIGFDFVYRELKIPTATMEMCPFPLLLY